MSDIVKYSLNGAVNGFRLGMFATGSYSCECCECGFMFQGNKRCVICLPCAISDMVKADKKKDETIDTQKELLKDMAEWMGNLPVEVASFGNLAAPSEHTKEGGKLLSRYKDYLSDITHPKQDTEK